MSIVYPKVAVLLATYNGEKNIYDQLDSIDKQQNINLHIIVSDDISNDGTVELIKKHHFQHVNLQILPFKKANGAGDNFLRLVCDSNLDKFDYIAYADQDDIWLCNKLLSAVKSLKNKTADGYSCNVTAFWPNGKRKLINKAQPQQKYDYMFESAGPGCTFVLSRKLALELQAFLIKHRDECNEVALHDWFTYAFARSKGFKWVIDKDPHMLYRQHQDNVVGANVGFSAKKLRWKRLREGWYRNQVMLLARLFKYDTEFPIKALIRYSFIDRMYLIVNVRKFRRNVIDAMALALFFILPLKK